MTQHALRLVAIELIQQTSSHDHLGIVGSRANRGGICDRRIDEAYLRRRQTRGDSHLIDDGYELMLLEIAGDGLTRTELQQYTAHAVGDQNQAEEEPRRNDAKDARAQQGEDCAYDIRGVAPA